MRGACTAETIIAPSSTGLGAVQVAVSALAIGLFTAWAALVSFVEMMFAYMMVHAPQAPWPVENRGELALVAPAFIPRHGERPGQEPRCREVTAPLPTVTRTPAPLSENSTESPPAATYGATPAPSSAKTTSLRPDAAGIYSSTADPAFV